MTPSAPPKTNEPGGRIRALLVDRDPDSLMRASQALQATGRIEIAAETITPSIIPSMLTRHNPEFVFLAVDGDQCAWIEKIRATGSTARIVAMGEAGQSDLVLRCWRSGVDEFLTRPIREEEILAVLDRLQQAPRTAAAPTASVAGAVLGLLGSRGGCGTTSLACNIALALHAAQPAVLVDLHFGQGDLGLHLNLRPAFSLSDLSDTGDRYDDTLLDSVTTRHASGLHLLLQPSDGSPVNFSVESLGRLIRRLQAKYPFVVLDLGSDIGRAAALSSSLGKLLLVVSQDLPAVFLASQKIQSLCQASFDLGRLDVIVNNYTRSRAVTLGRIAKALNKKNLVAVRSDEARVLAAINQGIPLRDVSRWGRALKDIHRYTQALLKQEALPAVPEEPVPTERATMNGSLLHQITIAS